jgi:uncharacterized protein YbjT (DUF2867 family)
MVKLTDFLGSILPKFDRNAGPILVTDVTGVVGYRVALKLLAAKVPFVRVGATDPSLVEDEWKARGAEVVAFDFDKPETYAKALKGIKSIYLAVPHHEGWQDNLEAFLAAKKKAGIKHIVKLSISHALTSQADTMKGFAMANDVSDPFLKVPLVLMHRDIDSKLMKLPRNYTILFASHFMSNPTVYQHELIRKEHRFVGASAAHGVAYVSPNDVADVAVKALLEPQHFWRTGLNLTGPAAVKDTEIATVLRYERVFRFSLQLVTNVRPPISHHTNGSFVVVCCCCCFCCISSVLGTDITFDDKPILDFTDEAQDTNWGPSVDVAYLELCKASGMEEQPKFISKDIEKICGHSAESYRDYLGNKTVMTPQERMVLIA